MRDREEWVEEVCSRIRWKPARRQVREELEAHIEDQEEAFLAEGMEKQEAEKRAVETMGDARTVGEKLDRIHRPGWDWKVVLMTVIMIAVGSLVLVSITKVSAIRGTEYIGMHLRNFLPAVIVFLVCCFCGYPVIERFPVIAYFAGSIIMLLLARYFHKSPDAYHLLYIMLTTVLFACAGEKLLKRGTIGYVLLLVIWWIKSLNPVLIDWFQQNSMPELVFLETIFFLILIKKQEASRRKKWLMSGIVLVSLCLVTIFLSRFIRYEISVRPQIELDIVKTFEIKLLGSAHLAQEGLGNADSYFHLYPWGWEFNMLFFYILVYYGLLPMLLLLFIVGAWIYSLFRLTRAVKNRKASVLSLSCLFLLCYQTVKYLIQNMFYINGMTTSLPFLSYGRTTMLLNAALFGLFMSAYRYGRITEGSKSEHVRLSGASLLKKLFPNRQ